MLLSSSCLDFTCKMFEYMNHTPYIIGDHHRMICKALDDVVKGKTRKLIINIAPRYGKCVSPDTKILTWNGLTSAKDLHGGEILYSYDKGKLVLRRCVAVGKAYKPSVRIKMRSGKEFVCSYDHPMLTDDGYRAAGTLIPDDKIVSLCCRINNGGKEINDSELVSAARKLCESHDQNMPGEWFSLSIRQRSLVIDAIFGNKPKGKEECQSLNLYSRETAEDIQLMLSTVGINSSLKYDGGQWLLHTNENVAKDSFCYDKVNYVEDAGDMDLVDIEVEGTHNFIGNGLVSHNTLLVSQMFIAYGMAINPQSKFLHLSYSGELTIENSMAVRDILLSDYFQAVFETRPRIGDFKKQKWSTEQGGGMYATSTLGQITGFGAGRVEREDDGNDYDENDVDAYTAMFNPDHFAGAIVIDDPLRPDDALSDTVRESVNRRFETTIRNRVNSRKTPMIVIMQRLHEHDLSGYLQEIEPDQWTVLSIPTIQTDDNGNEKALWPFKHTLEELHHLRAVNPFVFDTQYMQNPKPMEGLLYRDFDTYGELPKDNAGKVCCYVDSADKGTDYLCAIAYTERPEGNYLKDVMYTQQSMEITEPELAHFLEKNEVEYCTIESNNGGGIFKRNVKRIYVSEGYSKCSFFELVQKENKEVRLFSKANEVNNVTYMPVGWDKLWPHFATHIKSFRKQGRNLHDDAEDALTGTYEMRGAYGKDEGALCSREDIRAVFEDVPVDATGVHIGSAVTADNLHKRFVVSTWTGNLCSIVGDQEDVSRNDKRSMIQSLMQAESIVPQRFIIDEDNPDYAPLVNGATIFNRNKKPYNPEFDSIRTECGFRLAEMINHGLLKIQCSNEQRERIIDDLCVLKQAGVRGDVKKYSLIRREQMTQLLGRTPDYLDMLMQGMVFRLRKGDSNPTVKVQTHSV